MVVAETDDGEEVGFANPKSMLDIADSPDLRPVADEAEKLRRGLGCEGWEGLTFRRRCDER